MMAPMIFCAYRMVQLDTKRVYLHKDIKPWHKTLLRIGNLIYLFGLTVFFGIFVISPGVDHSLWTVKAHSYCFVTLIPALGIRTALDFSIEVAAGTPITTAHKAFFTFFMVVTCAE